MSGEALSSIDRPRRWDVPYADELIGSEMDYAIVRDLLRSHLKHLSKDRKRFPADLGLSDILRHDTRVRHFKEGELIVREGEYGNSAFMILEGSVNVVLSKLPTGETDQVVKGKLPQLLSSATRVFKKRFPYPENRSKSNQLDPKNAHRQIIHLQDFPEFLTENSGENLNPDIVKTLTRGNDQIGEIFGELAAFSRTPRTATVLSAENGTRLLEVRWQGLRDIRKFSPQWKEMIDTRYRSTSLGSHLAGTEYVRNLSANREDAPLIEELGKHAHFRSFGEYSWKASFKEMAEAGVADAGKGEPIILQQGNLVSDFVIIRNGFVRVTRKYNHGEKTVAYLGKGQTYGMLELFHNSCLDKDDPDARPIAAQHTLRAVGYVDLLVIPAPVVEAHVIPKLTQDDIARLTQEKAQLDSSESNESRRDGKMMEFLLEHRAINGTASMLIDLDRCTHCDDCVRACAATHDDNPRFIRQGPSQDGIQLTHACMHCVDPVCMIGCPTGAIRRDAAGNQVVINESTCIGCSTCADNCPYDNIQMVELRDRDGDFLPGTRFDDVLGATRLAPTESPLRKATKCDLCETLPSGPACANACPHDAMIRVDLTEPTQLFNWLDRK